MKKIKLLKLILRDFQGGTFILDVGGDDILVFGENTAGKTRLFSAFTWLLFNKDSLNRTDFSIKNLDAHGEVEDHNIQHLVEGILEIEGDKINLKKIYSEKFTKNRGRATAEYAGNSTQYFIDLVPKAEGEYKAFIRQIAGDEQTFRLLTSPTAFPQLAWQKQRSILLEIFGDVSDADIIASDPQLAELPKILGKHKADDYKKIVLARQAELNKALGTAKQPGTIETRIDEVRRSLPDITGLNRKAIEKDIISLETALNDEKLKLQGIDTGGTIAELTKKMAGINADIQKMQDAHFTEGIKSVNRLNQQISEITELLRSNKMRVSSISTDIANKQRQADSIEQMLIPLREQWTEIDSREFQDSTEDICAACGQALPNEQVQDARDKALAVFNVRKAEDLSRIAQNGKELKDNKSRLIGEIDALIKEKDIISESIPEQEKNLQDITTKRDILKASAEDYSLITGYHELTAQKISIEDEIKADKEGKTKDRLVIQKNIDAYQVALTEAKENADKFTRRDAGEKRTAELKAEEKILATEAEKMASELFLIDLFTRIKVNMLNDKMTGQFDIVKWKLAEIQVNGAVNDQICELMVNGIGYNSGLNSAARTQAGCDIIRTLQRHYGLSAPVFIDNRESVSELPAMDCQTISLIVSPEDKTLRVEKSTKHVNVKMNRIMKSLDASAREKVVA